MHILSSFSLVIYMNGKIQEITKKSCQSSGTHNTYLYLQIRPIFQQKSIHCSAVIMRSLGAMNTDRVIRGPRYTEHDNHTHLHHCSFLQLLWDITHCMYVILYVPFLFIYFLFFLLLKLCACTLPDFRFILLIQ